MQLQWLVLVIFLAAIAADHFVYWRSFSRRVARDAAAARHTLWLQWALTLWTCSALVLWVWIAGGEPLSSVGLALPSGWRLWAPLALGAAFVLLQASTAMRLARLPAPSSKLRDQLGSTGHVMPHVASELPAFAGMAVTAGVCEELLFRGFLIWLLQPICGVWIAALLALALFAVAHAYQGREGVIRSATIGLVFTGIVLATRSLWPAIVLHALVDLMGGLVGWIILREPPAPARAAEASAPH